MNRSKLAVLAAAALATAGLGVAVPPGADAAAAVTKGVTRVVPGGQHTRLSAGGGSGELAPAVGPEAATVRAPVANRSLSSRAKALRGGLGLSGIPAGNTSITGSG